MKKHNIVENIILVLVFFIVMAFPYISLLFNNTVNAEKKETLSGSEEKVELSFEKLDDYVIQNFPNREQIIKTKNQLLYTLFDISPNANITKVGDNLFSTETLNYYLHNLYDVENKDVEELVNKFKTFNEFCKSKDKKMVIVLTPCKPRYYDGEFPLVDDIIALHDNSIKDSEKNMIDVDRDILTNNSLDLQKKIRPYNRLKNKLKNSGIKFFDAIELIPIIN